MIINAEIYTKKLKNMHTNLLQYSIYYKKVLIDRYGRLGKYIYINCQEIVLLWILNFTVGVIEIINLIF